MDIGSKFLQIEEGRAHFGVIEDMRQFCGHTEARVRWHKGYATWEPLVSLDLDEDVPA